MTGVMVWLGFWWTAIRPNDVEYRALFAGRGYTLFEEQSWKARHESPVPGLPRCVSAGVLFFPCFPFRWRGTCGYSPGDLSSRARVVRLSGLLFDAGDVSDTRRAHQEIGIRS